MSIIKRFTLRFVFIGIAVIMATGCQSAVADALIDTSRLQQDGLTRPWFTQVQMDVGRDRVETVTFDGEFLTVQTKRGIIQTIDGETGATVWVKNVGSPKLFTSSAGVGPNHTAVVNGSHLFIFDRKTGKHIWNRQLAGGAIGGPGVSKDYVFVPKVDGNLEVYSLDKPKPWKEVRSLADTQFPIWKYNSHGKTMVPPTVFDGMIGWANDRADFYVARLRPMEILFRVETFDNIVVPPVRINSFLYIVSIDGYLYKVHARTGDIYWRFSTGSPLIHRPIAVDGFIYLSTPDGGLYRVLADEEVAEKSGLLDAQRNKKSEPAQQQALKEGKEVWFNPHISQVLSVTRDRIFGLDNKGNIQIVATQSGKSMGSVSTKGISLPITNHLTDRIYLATSNGLIQCLRDLKRVSPEKHNQAPHGKSKPRDEQNKREPNNPGNAEQEDNSFRDSLDDSQNASNDGDNQTDEENNPFE